MALRKVLCCLLSTLVSGRSARKANYVAVLHTCLFPPVRPPHRLSPPLRKLHVGIAQDLK